MPSIFVACAPGLEPVLATELADRGIGRGQQTAGGVTLRGGKETIYRANLESGLALKVRVRLGRFEARHFSQLEKRARELPWEDWLEAAGPVRVSARRSKLFHTGAIAERFDRVLAERFGGARGGPEVFVRLARDRCSVSVDTSGEILVRRGYRRGTGKAPLRPDLARAIAIGSGWDQRSSLVDPFCGSGTIVIEAALLATRRPPGLHRQFAFESSPGFDQALWDRVREIACKRIQAVSSPFLGSDRDAGVIDVAADNAARAGVEIEFHCAAVSSSPCFESPPAIGAVCSNLPFGERVSHGQSLLPLYQRFAEKLASLPGWRVGLVVANPELAVSAGLPCTPWIDTNHGGLDVALMTGSIDAMS